jgi:hypothetical protein
MDKNRPLDEESAHLPAKAATLPGNKNKLKGDENNVAERDLDAWNGRHLQMWQIRPIRRGVS